MCKYDVQSDRAGSLCTVQSSRLSICTFENEMCRSIQSPYCKAVSSEVLNIQTFSVLVTLIPAGRLHLLVRSQRITRVSFAYHSVGLMNVLSFSNQLPVQQLFVSCERKSRSKQIQSSFFPVKSFVFFIFLGHT